MQIFLAGYANGVKLPTTCNLAVLVLPFRAKREICFFCAAEKQIPFAQGRLSPLRSSE